MRSARAWKNRAHGVGSTWRNCTATRPPAIIRHRPRVESRARGPDSISRFPTRFDPAEALLLDGPAGELFGGAGEDFDWKLRAPKPIILAGGLDASNVA
jgi:phosphoribosylanthranilate isomerase